MSQSNIIVGNIGGEKWVGTNNDGVGKMLFKLSDSEDLKHNHDRLLEENKRLREALRAVVMEFDSDYLDESACGLILRINKELDGDK